MTNTAAAKTAGLTDCECSNYDALIGEQLTDENLANGDYEIFTTGCMATTKNTFAPGHDAKLKSFLIKHEALGHEIRRNVGGVAVTRTAADHASGFAFAHMVIDGIAKAQAKAEAKATRQAKTAERKAAKGKPAQRKLAESAGIVSHDGNEARQAREAKATNLAQIVADEEAAHAEAVKRNQPTPEWDDAPTAPVLEDEGAMNAHAQDAREDAGLVTAKVGRWEYSGYVNEDGTFSYLAKDGRTRKTVPAGKYKLA